MGWPVICPKCHKKGTLTLKRVRGTHYGYVTIISGGEVVSITTPAHRARAERLGLVVEREVYNPRVGSGQENKVVVKRLKQIYGPWVHPYVRHYDSQKYRQSMEKYKAGKLKARPNGVKWCHIRTTPQAGETTSQYSLLLWKYDIGYGELEKDVKSNKFWMAFRRNVKLEKQLRCAHPLYRIIENLQQKRAKAKRKIKPKFANQYPH